ncbi:MAG: IS200/IS605 family transposase [Armatimonadetes bacterium]|nr:IS200/IS605 family transposase [Armatimonadota bacterium]
MRTPYTQLYVHLVWATWDRLPLITAEMEARLYACMRQKCREFEAELLEIGGIEDHVHLLVRIPAKLSIAELVKQVKGSSSHLVSHEMPGGFFKWQGAYGAFTVSPGEVIHIQTYIQRQKEHHGNHTLIGEYELSPVLP